MSDRQERKSPPTAATGAGFDHQPSAGDILAQYAAAGFHFVRIPRRHGQPTKGPTGTGWNLPRTADNPEGYTPDVERARGWLKAGDNIGLALLPSRVASLDLDDFDEARRLFAEIGLPLDTWLNDPGRVEIRSGKAGKGKLLFYVEVPELIEGSHKLVFGRRPNERAIFELRFCSKDGKTVQDLLPPSIHPDTGRPYELIGDPARMPPLPPALLKLWQEWPDALLKSFDPEYVPPAEPKPRADRPVLRGERDPMEEFNAGHPVGAVLERNGYKRKGRRYLRPGSESGIPGVTTLDSNGRELAYSHGGDLLNDGHGHDAFDCFRLLECGGDWARALAWNPDINAHNKQLWEAGKAQTKARLAELALTLRGQGIAESKVLDALLRENQGANPALLDAEIKAVLRASCRRGPGGNGAGGPVEWPEPILPGTVKTPDIPATLLPSWVGDMAAAVSASTQTPPALSVMAALAVLAAVLQRRFEVAPWGAGDDYREPLAIWALAVAPSGSRKTAVLSALAEPLVAWEKRQRDRMRAEIARVESAREVAKKRVERLKQEAAKAKSDEDRERIRGTIQEELEKMPGELFPPRLFSGDVTGERLQQLLVEQDERMTVLTDEGGIFQVMSGQYSGGMASLDVFLQGHSGSPLRVDRAGRLAHIDRPALSFGLALQPGILADAAKARRFRDSGLLARFLYALPKSNVGHRNVRERCPIPEGVKQAWAVRIFDLLDGMERPIGTPKVIPFSAEAHDIWLEFYEAIERNQGEGRKWEAIADWTAKLPGAVARVAGLLDLAAHGTGITAVSLDSAARAVALGELLIEHALGAFSLMGAGKAEDDALAVLRWIEVHRLAGFTRREAQKAMESRFRSIDRLLAALNLLREWACLSDEIKPESGVSGGRPSPRYEVNPRLWEVKAA